MMLPHGLSEQIDAYLDGDLEAAEIEQLSAWLMEDQEHARQFFREVYLHGELRNSFLARGNAECLNSVGDTSSRVSVMTFFSNWMHAGGGGLSRPWLSTLSVVLAICGVVLLGMSYWRSASDNVSSAHQSSLGQMHDGDNDDVANINIVAHVTRLWKPEWSDRTQDIAEWTPLREGQVIDLVSGRAEIFFKAGAQLILEGPVRFKVLGPKSGRVFRGDLTARVGKSARGFSLLTSVGKVIDLGTEFGLSVQPDGQTDVVVFDGVVDLEHREHNAEQALRSTKSGMTLSRLTTGEAVRINPDGSAQRIVAVEADRFARAAVGTAARPSKSRVISGVRDTIRKPGTGPFYEIVRGGMGEEARAYVDRRHEWNGVDASGIPEFLRGADYVKTFNDDKHRGPVEITVELSQPADLYVLWDDRWPTTPAWLLEGFTHTGFKIGVDETPCLDSLNGGIMRPNWVLGVGAGNSIETSFSIWHRRIEEPGAIQLGPAKLADESGEGRSMYGIAAKALSP